MEYVITFFRWFGGLFLRSKKEIDDARTVNEITINTIQTLSQQFAQMTERFEECDTMHREASKNVHRLELENIELRKQILELKVELAEMKQEVAEMKSIAKGES